MRGLPQLRWACYEPTHVMYACYEPTLVMYV